METLILRLAARHARGSSNHRFEGEALSIGRGPRNQVFVDDPYVGAEQFLLRRHGEEILLEVLDHTNPVFINRRHRTVNPLALAVGDRIDIGHTHMTLLSESSAVEPARVLSFALWSRLGAWQPLIALALWLLVFASTLCLNWLAVYEKPQWGDLASQSLMFALAMVAWAALWAIVGRLLRGQPAFFGHLFYVCAATVLDMANSIACSWLAYASGFTQTMAVVEWVIEAVIGIALLFGNLRLATHLRRPALAATLFVIVLVGLVLGIEYLQQDDFDPGLEVQTLLKPPLAKLRGGESLEGYEEQLSELFGELRRKADKEAAKEAVQPPDQEPERSTR